MKKIVLISGLMFLMLAFPVKAANKQNATIKEESVDAMQGNQVQNKNVVETKNMGEDQQLMVNTSENESLQSSGSGAASKKVMAVSEALDGITTVKGKNNSGEEVDEVVKQQKQAQGEIETQLDKLETRKGLTKTLLGPDYKAIKNLKQLKEQNQLRIENLKELQVQLFNFADQTKIQEAVQVLVEQNTALEEKIQNEESLKSLFGWLMKMFV